MPPGPGCSRRGRRVARSAPRQPPSSGSGSRPLSPGPSCRAESGPGKRRGEQEEESPPLLLLLPSLPPQGRLGNRPRRIRKSAPSLAVPPAGSVGRLGGLHQPRLYSCPGSGRGRECGTGRAASSRRQGGRRRGDRRGGELRPGGGRDHFHERRTADPQPVPAAAAAASFSSLDEVPELRPGTYFQPQDAALQRAKS